MSASDLITVDPDVLGGTPVFQGTRVPVKTLFEYLEGNYTLDEFLECFPSVTRQMACQLLDRSELKAGTGSRGAAEARRKDRWMESEAPT